MDELAEGENKYEFSHRADYSAFGRDLEMMIEVKRLALNNLYLFDLYYLEDPHLGVTTLGNIYAYYRYPRTMLGSDDKKKELDDKFQKLIKKLWDFEDHINIKRKQIQRFPQVRRKTQERFREIYQELSSLLDEVLELAQERGLGIPSSTDLPTSARIKQAIER